MKFLDKMGLTHLVSQLRKIIDKKADITYVDERLNQIEPCQKLLNVTKRYTISNNRENPLPKPFKPGPQSFIGGDEDAGFYGEVSTDLLFTGEELATELKLNSGVSQNNTEPWLKFSHNGKTLYKSKKSYRHSISRDAIENVGGVKGEATIVKNGIVYKIRLLRGATTEIVPQSSGFINHGSEWNELMLPIHKDSVEQNWAYEGNVRTPTESWGVNYTNEDFGFGGYDGERQWTLNSLEDGQALYRGWSDITVSASFRSNASGNTAFGWSPVLEVVGPVGSVDWSKNRLEPTAEEPYLWAQDCYIWDTEPHKSYGEPYLLSEYQEPKDDYGVQVINGVPYVKKDRVIR